MKKRILVVALLASVSLWIGLTLFYRSAYQRGYRQGASDGQLRSQARYEAVAVMGQPQEITLDNEVPSLTVRRSSPVFQNTSRINTMPAVPKN